MPGCKVAGWQSSLVRGPKRPCPGATECEQFRARFRTFQCPDHRRPDVLWGVVRRSVLVGDFERGSARLLDNRKGEAFEVAVGNRTEWLANKSLALIYRVLQAPGEEGRRDNSPGIS